MAIRAPLGALFLRLSIAKVSREKPVFEGR